MSRHAMNSADVAWLRMDRPRNLMVITSVLWFDRPLELAALRELLRERLVERFPRYAQRVVDGGALGGARWEDDPDFDLDLHIHHRALPAPGGRAELQDFVADLMATPLDRSKPLWHCYLVDNYAGGGALVFRMHHCIADGIALARVMLSLTDALPEGATSLEVDPSRPDGRLTRAPGPFAPALRSGRALAGALVHEGVETLLHPRHVRDLAGGAGSTARAIAKELLTLPDRGALHGGALRPGERVAWCEPIPLDHVKAIAREHEATVNDVLVSAVAGGLQRWMAEHGGVEREIHAMVPFNLRPLDRPLPADLGNRFGLVLLALPLVEPEPIARLYEVKRRMRAIKESPEGLVSYGLLASMGVSPSAVETRLIDFFSAKASLVLTNVPGPRHPVYLTGARLRGVLVWAPCAGSVPMSVSIFSYDGEVTVGFMVDAGLVPDPEAIVREVEAELGELAQSVPSSAPAPAQEAS